MTKLTNEEQKARERLCLDLNVPTVEDAKSVALELKKEIKLFKIGAQLHASAGCEEVNLIGYLHSFGAEAYLDLKVHNSPKTVYELSKIFAKAKVAMFSVHIAGGEEMCKRAIDGATDGVLEKLDRSAKNKTLERLFLETKDESKIDSDKLNRPKVIGVTELANIDDYDLEAQGLNLKYDDLVRKRTELAREWNLDGITCPANKVGALEKEFGSDFIYVTSGISWKNDLYASQKQLCSLEQAVKNSSNSILVLGDTILKSKDKIATTKEILENIAKYSKK